MKKLFFRTIILFLIVLFACQFKEKPVGQVRTSAGRSPVNAVSSDSIDSIAGEEHAFTPIFIPDAWVQVAMQHKNDSLPEREWMQLFDWLDSEWRHERDPNDVSSRCDMEMRQLNLDEDAEEELVFYCDHPVKGGIAGVLNRQDEKWYLVFITDASYWEIKRPFIRVDQLHKIFYIEGMVALHTSFHEVHTSFFRMSNQKVHQCLELVRGRSSTDLWIGCGSGLSTQFHFLENSDLKVIYDYEFHRAYVHPKIKRPQIDITFVEGKEVVFYRWNADSLKYLLDIPKESGLTTKKLEVLMEGDWGEMPEVFKAEIATMLKNGTALQKNYWQETMELGQ